MTSPTKIIPDLRVLRQKGTIRGLAICGGEKTLARLPLPKDRRSLVVAVSIDGQQVAWRTTSKASGTLSVGQVSRRVVRNARTSTTRTLRGPLKGQQVNGRLMVTPDGSVAWSLPVGTRAGVWLWPAGEKPRRVALTHKNDGGNAGRDVRIVDRHHVLIGYGTELARYGPRTPGACPVALGVTSADVGPLAVRYSAGSYTENENGDSGGASHLLVCDPTVGDYTRIIRFGSGGSGSGGSGNVGFDGEPARVAFTAGTLVIERVTRTSGGGSSDTSYDALIVPRDPRSSIRTATGGGIAGPGIDPPPVPTDWPSTSSRPVAVRLAPGAVAWSEGDPRTADNPRPIWLTDAGGSRIVGNASRRRIPTAPGYTLGPDVELTLDTTIASWYSEDGTGRTQVAPTADPGLAIEPVK